MDSNTLLDTYLSAMRVEGRAPTVVANRRTTLGRLVRTTGIPLLEQNEESIARHVASLTPGQQSSARSRVRVFYTWAVREGLVETNPVPDHTPAPHPLPFDTDELQLVRAYEAHLDYRGFSPYTISCTRLSLARVRRAAGRLLDVEPHDIENYLRSFGKDNGSRGSELSRLRTFYQWTRRAGYLAVEPTADLIAPRDTIRLPHPISETDLQRALQGGRHVRPMLLLAGWAGLRAREIAHLHADHLLLNITQPRVEIHGGKSRRDASVPLAPAVVDALVDCDLPTTGWVFPKRAAPSEHRTPSSISRSVNCWLTELGIDSSLHELRHRFATETYRLTLDLRLTQELMRHTSPATTARYTLVAPTKLAAAVELLPSPR